MYTIKILHVHLPTQSHTLQTVWSSVGDVTSLETLTSVCLVQMLEAVEVNGQPLQNECDCPLLTLLSTINAVSPSDILTEVSIIHECNDSCKFVEDGATIQVERETIQSKRLAYVHDWSITNGTV